MERYNTPSQMADNWMDGALIFLPMVQDWILVILKGPFPHQPFYDFIPSCIFSRLKRLFLWYFRARKAATIARIEAFFAPDQILIHVP